MTRGPGTPPDRARLLHGRYLVRQPLARLALRSVDFVLGMLHCGRHQTQAGTPRRVLLSVGGHLGDAVVATTAVRLLRDALPDVEIGVLAPSWSRAVFAGHPAIRWLHHVDHWKLDRARTSILAAWRHHRETARTARREIRSVGYDHAVDLYPYFPNAAPLLYRTGIPERIGFVSGGFGPLYTRPLTWEDRPENWHTAEQHRYLLLQLPGMPSEAATVPLRYDLPPLDGRATEAVARRLRADAPAAAPRYVVVHPGAGSARKEWSVAGWRSVVGTLSRHGIATVVTGQGASQERMAREIAHGIPGCASLAGRLDWESFRAVLAGAAVVASVDTVAPHVAAATGVPVVVLSAGTSDIEHWHPLGSLVTVLQADLTPATVERAVLEAAAAASPVPHVSLEHR